MVGSSRVLLEEEEERKAREVMATLAEGMVVKGTVPAVRALGAKPLYLYGSDARDEARPDSDIDIFIDKDPTRQFGFDEFMTIYFKLRETLGTEVGYTTRDGLVEFYRPDIEREAIRVF